MFLNYLIIIIISISIFLLIYFLGYIFEHGNDINFNYSILYYKDKIVDIDNCEEYINFKESLEPYLKYYSKKEIIFQKRSKTSKVFYVIHGFNADKNECNAIANKLSLKYSYNTLLARLPDHGIFNKEACNNTFYTYLRTIYDDLIICKLLGEEIIVVSASTGSTYSIIISVYFSTRFNIKDNIMFSPNIEPNGLHVVLLTKLLFSGFGNFILGLTRNKICIDDYKVSSDIFKPMIGALATLRNVKKQFKNNCIIFTSKNDKIISNNAIRDFLSNINVSKKYLYSFKDLDIHPISKYTNNDIMIDKIADYLAQTNDTIIDEEL